MSLRRIFVGVLATIGALAIVGACFVAVIFLPIAAVASRDKPDRFLSAVQSPDGSHKAVLLTQAGGGAMSPYCYDVVYVVPKGSDNEETTRHDENEVFSAACSTFPYQERMPKLEWASNTSLRITFALDTNLLRSVRLRSVDASGKIRVGFTTIPSLSTERK